jgi:hypothetical protein
MGIRTPTLSSFMRGERPLPAFRAVALIRLVTILLEGMGSPAQPLSTKHALRAQAVRRSVEHWRDLAIAELGDTPADVDFKGNALANQMLDQLLDQEDAQ